VRSGIGIDLVLRTSCLVQRGEGPRSRAFLRQLADKLGTAQRARKRRHATNLHARIVTLVVTFTINSRPASFESSIAAVAM